MRNKTAYVIIGQEDVVQKLGKKLIHNDTAWITLEEEHILVDLILQTQRIESDVSEILSRAVRTKSTSQSSSLR